MLLSVENVLDKQPTTLSSYFAVNGTAGGTAIAIKNTTGFNAQWAAQLGRTGEETAEILNIDSIGGMVLNTSGTVKFAHSIDTPVYQIHYDKVIFLRSTSGTSGTASALSTVSITPDSFYTEYDDNSGASTYAYQTQYYNSVTGDVSGTSDWYIPGGPTFYSLQKLRSRAKSDLYSANYIKDDQTIDTWINEWVEQMTNSALKLNQGYSIGTAAYAFGTAGLGTITEPLFKYAKKIEITLDGTNYINSSEIPVNRFTSSDIVSSNSPRHYWQGNTIFGVLPNGNLGTARMTLGELNSQLVNDSDELPQFLKSYTYCCIEYLLYKAFDLDQKTDIADRHYNKFRSGKADFIGEMTPRDQTGVKTIDFEEELTGSDIDMAALI